MGWLAVIGVAVAVAASGCSSSRESEESSRTATGQQPAAAATAPAQAPPAASPTARTVGGVSIDLRGVERAREWSLIEGGHAFQPAEGWEFAIVRLRVGVLKDGSALDYAQMALEGEDGRRYASDIAASDLCDAPPGGEVDCSLPIPVPAGTPLRAFHYRDARFDVPAGPPAR